MNNGRLKKLRLPNCVHHHYRQITFTLQRALFGAHLHRFRLHFDDLAGFADLQFQVASRGSPTSTLKVASVLQENAHIAPWKCLHLVDCSIRFQSKIIACDLSS